MKRTVLYQAHQKLGAKMTPFAGFEMPLSYRGAKDEYLEIRNNVGLFDISHMCPIFIEAENSETIIDYLNHITCRDVGNLDPFRVQYNALVNEQGGVVDDITIYTLRPLLTMIIANASNRETVIEHLTKYRNKLGSSCTIHPATNYIFLAVQGPSSEQYIRRLKKITCEIDDLYYYECVELGNQKIERCKSKTTGEATEIPQIISRTGYTGEDGFEILLETGLGIEVWEELLQLGVQACGLASRDLLRMEVFYPLYGQELSEEKTPAESGIGWLISESKKFIGKSKILVAKEKPIKKTKGFQLLEAGVPRQGYKIFTENEQKVGVVTSGSYSFQWERGFGMAYLDVAYANAQQKLFLRIRGENKKIIILDKSPYKGSIRKRP